MKDQSVMRDERTVVVENASYRWAYLLLSYGILAHVAHRSYVLQQTNWDLMALVVLGGVVATVYQGVHRVLSRKWVFVTGAAMLVAAAVALVTGYFR